MNCFSIEKMCQCKCVDLFFVNVNLIPLLLSLWGPILKSHKISFKNHNIMKNRTHFYKSTGIDIVIYVTFFFFALPKSIGPNV